MISIIYTSRHLSSVLCYQIFRQGLVMTLIKPDADVHLCSSKSHHNQFSLCLPSCFWCLVFSFTYIYITIQYFLDVSLPAHWSKKIYILCHEETRQNAEELYTFFQGLGCECHLDTEEYDKVAECMPYRYVLENMKTAGHVLICISPKLKEAFEANRTKCKFKTLYEALDLYEKCTPAAARSS